MNPLESTQWRSTSSRLSSPYSTSISAHESTSFPHSHSVQLRSTSSASSSSTSLAAVPSTRASNLIPAPLPPTPPPVSHLLHPLSTLLPSSSSSFSSSVSGISPLPPSVLSLLTSLHSSLGSYSSSYSHLSNLYSTLFHENEELHSILQEQGIRLKRWIEEKEREKLYQFEKETKELEDERKRKRERELEEQEKEIHWKKRQEEYQHELDRKWNERIEELEKRKHLEWEEQEKQIEKQWKYKKNIELEQQQQIWEQKIITLETLHRKNVLEEKQLYLKQIRQLEEKRDELEQQIREEKKKREENEREKKEEVARRERREKEWEIEREHEKKDKERKEKEWEEREKNWERKLQQIKQDRLELEKTQEEQQRKKIVEDNEKEEREIWKRRGEEEKRKKTGQEKLKEIYDEIQKEIGTYLEAYFSSPPSPTTMNLFCIPDDDHDEANGKQNGFHSEARPSSPLLRLAAAASLPRPSSPSRTFSPSQSSSSSSSLLPLSCCSPRCAGFSYSLLLFILGTLATARHHVEENLERWQERRKMEKEAAVKRRSSLSEMIMTMESIAGNGNGNGMGNGGRIGTGGGGGATGEAAIECEEHHQLLTFLLDATFTFTQLKEQLTSTYNPTIKASSLSSTSPSFTTATGSSASFPYSSSSLSPSSASIFVLSTLTRISTLRSRLQLSHIFSSWRLLSLNRFHRQQHLQFLLQHQLFKSRFKILLLWKYQTTKKEELQKWKTQKEVEIRMNEEAKKLAYEFENVKMRVTEVTKAMRMMERIVERNEKRRIWKRWLELVVSKKKEEWREKFDILCSENGALRESLKQQIEITNYLYKVVNQEVASL